MLNNRANSIEFTVSEIKAAMTKAREECFYTEQEIPKEEFEAMYGTKAKLLIRVIKKGF